MEEALRRVWENLIGRADGPMNLRLLIQPAVAVFFAIRAGLRDARSCRPPFLWTVFSDPDQRRELLRQGWRDIGTVFIVALILDLIYQIIVNSGIYVLESLLTATILAILPYAMIRGLVTRLARRQPALKPCVEQHGNQAKLREDRHL